MFEGSLVESRKLAGTGTERWTALGSMTIQCAVAGLLIAIPLLRPQVLAIAPDAPKLAIPFPVRPPAIPIQASSAPSSASTAVTLPTAMPVMAASGPTFWTHPTSTVDGPVPSYDPSQHMGAIGPGPIGIVTDVGPGTGPGVVVRPKIIGPTKVSTGVSEGLLLTPIQPVYPAIAKATRTQGKVVLEAVISKVGRIESLRAVSGPNMLREAALEAVERARYRPYLLNGEPTEVQTTITVVFTLGS
jgi:protein TonB